MGDRLADIDWKHRLMPEIVSYCRASLGRLNEGRAIGSVGEGAVDIEGGGAQFVIVVKCDFG